MDISIETLASLALHEDTDVRLLATEVSKWEQRERLLLDRIDAMQRRQRSLEESRAYVFELSMMTYLHKDDYLMRLIEIRDKAGRITSKSCKGMAAS